MKARFACPEGSAKPLGTLHSIQAVKRGREGRRFIEFEH